MKEAEDIYRVALTIDPNFALTYNNFGVLLQKQGNLTQASEFYAKAISLDPRYADAYSNLGTVYRDQERLEDAAEQYEKAIALSPNHAVAHSNLGVVHQARYNYHRAAECYARALDLRPDSGQFMWNLGFIQLLFGDFVSGFRNFEGRWSVDAEPRNFVQPLWLGEPLNGATLLLHAEQGLGDTLFMLRYIPRVVSSTSRVVLEVQQRLLGLAKQIPGVSLVLAAGDPLPHFDVQCPLMSLPLIFGTTLSTIPAAVPYITIPDEALTKTATLPWPSKPRVGIVWAGSPLNSRDQERSMLLASLGPLIAEKSISFFSVQKGPGASQLANKPADLIDLDPWDQDMTDTAALLSNLDLLISVDTSVAHLAGALGMRIWVMLAYSADWRYLLDREDSPWYTNDASVPAARSPGTGIQSWRWFGQRSFSEISAKA